MTREELAAAADAAFERRRDPVGRLAADAPAIALACRAMAECFLAGGRLLVLGAGACVSDAEHIAVEFVHPVIVGKRALPALALAADISFSRQLQVLGRPGDIALGLSADGNSGDVDEGLAAARGQGMLTVALVGGDGGAIAGDSAADHCVVVSSADALIVKECHVTAYHVLWELVHVFLDAPRAGTGAATGAGDVESLYPFLYGEPQPQQDLLASVARSTRDKIDEVVELRARVGADLAEPLAACARELASAFSAGATMWTFGNGGSSTDAQGVARTFLDPPRHGAAIAARCLTSDPAIVTALANDVGFDVVFARQLRAFARPGDVAIGLSTSGGSTNVLDALDDARRMGLITVGIAGYDGGRMAARPSIDHLFVVPSSSVHRVQEVQTTIYHVLWELTERVLSSAGGPARRQSLPGQD